MNKAMSRVFIVTAVLFVALVVNLTWIMVVRAQWFQDRPENKRSIAKEMKIKRGDIARLRRVGDRRHAAPLGLLLPRLPQRHASRRSSSATTPCSTGAAASSPSSTTSSRASRATSACRTGSTSCSAASPRGRTSSSRSCPAVQKVAQQELRASGARSSCSTPRRGALIASASAPTYDPANLEDQWSRLSKDPSAPLLNRPTQGLYVPGSSFKVVTASAGLDTGSGHAGLAVRRHRHLRGLRRQGHQLRRRGVRPQQLHLRAHGVHQHDLRQGRQQARDASG